MGARFEKGQRIIPADAHYPNAVLVVVGYEGEELLGYPEGGGPVYRFDPWRAESYRFRLVTKDDRPHLRIRAFFIDDDPKRFFGVTFGERWNGWACPKFPRSEAERLMRDGWGRATYDAATDEFIFWNDEAPDNKEEAAAVVAGAELFGGKVYPIGSHGWVWEDDDPTPEEIAAHPDLFAELKRLVEGAEVES